MNLEQLMHEPILRPFCEADADLIVNRDGTQCGRDALLQQARNGLAFTACVGKQPIACAGLVILWGGVGIAWMVLSEDIAGHGLWLTRTVRAFLDDMTRRHHLHRIEAVALQESPRNQQWLEALGFTSEKEGVAEMYLHDQRSVIRYERIRR